MTTCKECIKKGYSKNLWTQEVSTRMREKVTNMEWIDREE